VIGKNALFGPLDPAPDAGYADAPPRKGFFTDTSVCIGCKACEVACKEWNEVPDDGFNLLGMSYDNTGSLSANTWRHVAFIEQPAAGSGHGTDTPGAFAGMPTGPSASAHTAVVAAGTSQDTGTDPGVPAAPDALAAAATITAPGTQFLGMPGADLPGRTMDAPRSDFRWLMSSDVCKHCTHAACLDVCPTGSLFRTEFGTVVVQDDICNGCGYCVPACPYGVIERRSGPEGARNVGVAQKCTLCYDRLGAGQTPACAQACPTQSIQFGDVDELRERARQRVERLHADGVTDARLYGHDPNDGVGGAGAFFLLLDEPEVYGLPPDPVVTTRDLPKMFNRASAAAGALLVGAVLSFLGRRR
jgi:formate dehydrogenase iron-sulfur subunit